MIKKLILYIIILSILPVITSAQEVITGLQTNYNIYKQSDKQEQSKGVAASDTLELPFFDDFSNHSFLPDTKKWSDKFVFINNSYSDQQITTGIATFDAIDNTGRLYETASSTGFEADHLTSKPLNLNLSASANIWLSFFYQPGGLGDSPEANDSLALQFFAPAEAKWYSVWRAGGTIQQRFKPVIIRINQTRFLQRGFRFRFINHASLSANMSDPSMIGNCDQWNIDYVLIDKNRDGADTSLADVAFRTPLRSILKTHEAMPLKQFNQVYLQEMGSVIPIHYRNNDIITRNVTRNFVIRDVHRNIISHSFSAGATNISPLTNIDYNANLIYTFNTTNTDSALFRITCSLITDDFDPKQNDTIKYDQIFSNYFAFDDGSSEGGYGVNGLGSRNAMVAYRFKSYLKDTIRAVSICFNDSYLNSNIRTFDLMIWDENNGLPGNLLYSQEELMVIKSGEINGFHTYNLPDGVMVDDIFYVGWKQRSETFLNAGFDINTPHKGKQFYWLNGEWRQSQVQGSVMIRPVLGDALKTTSIDDTYYNKKKSFRLWPNPSSDFVTIDCDEILLSQSAYISFIDISGRELMVVPLTRRIDISSLSKGIYVLIINLNGKPAGYNRLVKTE